MKVIVNMNTNSIITTAIVDMDIDYRNTMKWCQYAITRSVVGVQFARCDYCAKLCGDRSMELKYLGKKINKN